ncbi:MAG TPA: translocation/assembly module TamB domain-containing protein, partial [Burkholderiaceae bacterium]|nr:translocation/assembly module TamB domain-containing protein [Burkholderiaceae bacterium]
PLDDPTVQIIAMRKFQPVEAGVIVTGTAKNPRVQLTSRPDVPDVEKLSWLVFGRGFEDARSAGQAAAVQGALLALQQARGGESGPGVAGRLGLDVLSIGAGTKPGEEGVVTLGKRLTDRLFVSYEQSLRGIHNLVRLQYELTDRLSLRVRTGSESSVDVVWTVPLN